MILVQSGYQAQRAPNLNIVICALSMRLVEWRIPAWRSPRGPTGVTESLQDIIVISLLVLFVLLASQYSTCWALLSLLGPFSASHCSTWWSEGDLTHNTDPALFLEKNSHHHPDNMAYAHMFYSDHWSSSKGQNKMVQDYDTHYRYSYLHAMSVSWFGPVPLVHVPPLVKCGPHAWIPPKNCECPRWSRASGPPLVPGVPRGLFHR